VISAPSFASPNRFAVLCNESDNILHASADTEDVQTSEPPGLPAAFQPKDPTGPPTAPAPPRVRKAAWERKLPARYTVAATPGPNSLHLPLEIESTNNTLKLSLEALVDCGVTSNFINSEYVLANRIPVPSLSQPSPVYNVDGSPNEAGSIREVADVILRYKGHSEWVQLAVT